MAWGWCTVCSRWFYPEGNGGVACCPVCTTEAARVAERPGESPPANV